MKAVLYEDFKAKPVICTVPDPVPDDDGAVIQVKASGICRSDWHGWQGHDPDIKKLPHVPGHELAGIVEEAGKNVEKWKPGDRITVPFVSGCGTCPECRSGNHQICDHQFQPGFTAWGSFAQYVALKYADINLVKLPEQIDFVTAASLGCRFVTAYRAVVAQGNLSSGQWLAVHGCGGVGLSAVMIASALGAKIIGIDINDNVLRLARSIGATNTIDANEVSDIPGAVHDITGRGAHLSIDALGSAVTCANSILCLRKRGRHVQIGLLSGDDHHPRLPMEHVIAKELEIYGSHGMQAHRYDELLEMIVSGKLDPKVMIGKTIPLEEAPQELAKMGEYAAVGITVIDRF